MKAVQLTFEKALIDEAMVIDAEAVPIGGEVVSIAGEVVLQGTVTTATLTLPVGVTSVKKPAVETQLAPFR